jgi:plasmid stability protein
MNNNGNLTETQAMAWRLDIFSRMTNQHHARRAEAEAEQVLRDAADIEGRRIMQEILAENARKAELAAYQMRELQNRNLEADLKRKFLSASPDATEQTWLICKADILKAYFIERFNAEQSREQIEQEIYAAWKM